ncbi:hypothetical protein LX92_02798 [Maribacter polysiphoniae]|uniref:Uncharacterized protein n=1 Tax=Maribacter polysiphoniae TaxID=429344 RepID=A0A316EIU0_9FLAO|nr:hypothetical protein LX92_02798 [Maribacter polysiphoniae]
MSICLSELYYMEATGLWFVAGLCARNFHRDTRRSTLVMDFPYKNGALPLSEQNEPLTPLV